MASLSYVYIIIISNQENLLSSMDISICIRAITPHKEWM